MEPRLPSSRQWTPLPQELLSQIESVMKESFGANLENADVKAYGRIYPAELLMKVAICRPNSLKQPGFEISIPYDPKKDNVMKLVHVGVDALASFFEQYFETNDDSEFPLIWQDFQSDGREIFAQYSTQNLSLETEADKLLGIDQENLVKEQRADDEESIRQLKEQLGVSDDEDDDVPPLKH